MTIENVTSPIDFNTEQAPLAPAKIPDEETSRPDILANVKVTPLSPAQDKTKTIVEKIKEVANPILKAGISAFLYWVNPSLFAIGFIAGIVFDDHIRSAIQKISNVWKNQELAGCLFGSFACALSLPVSLAAASLLWSAHFGTLMHPSWDETMQKLPGL